MECLECSGNSKRRTDEVMMGSQSFAGIVEISAGKTSCINCGPEIYSINNPNYCHKVFVFYLLFERINANRALGS